MTAGGDGGQSGVFNTGGSITVDATARAAAAAAQADADTANAYIVARLPEISVTESVYGAVGDGDPAKATANAAAIQAAATAAGNAATFNEHKILKFPPGEYCFNSPITVPAHVHIDQSSALLNYSGPNTSPAVTIGSAGVYSQQCEFKGLRIKQAPPYSGISPAVAETNIGYQFLNHNRQLTTMHRIEGFPIGLQHRGNGNSNYGNTTIGGAFFVCKIGIDIYSENSDGWCNDSNFHNIEFSSSSSVDNWGSIYCVRFAAEAGAYFPQNDHRFSGCIWQPYYHSEVLTVGKTVYYNGYYYSLVGGTIRRYRAAQTDLAPFVVTTIPTHSSGTANGFAFVSGTSTAGYDLLVGMTTATGSRYRQPNTGAEYYCTAGQVITTLPTHTDTSTPEGMQYVGPHYFRVPVYHRQAGGNATFNACRYETGYGPFAVVDTGIYTNGGNYDFAEYGNEFDAWRMNGRKRRVYSYSTTSVLQKIDAVATTQGEGGTRVHEISDIAHRFIGSSLGCTIRGFQFQNYTSDAASYKSSGDTHWRLGHDWIEYSSSPYYPGVLVEVGDYYRFAVRLLGVPKPNAGRPSVFPIDKNFKSIHYTDGNQGQLICDGSTWSGAVDNYYTGNDTSRGMNIAAIDPAIKYLHMGMRQAAEAASNGRLQLAGLKITAYGEANPAGRLRVFSQFDTPGRVSYGTPTMGHFPAVGEIIGNQYTAGGQPYFFIVLSAGVLTKAWATSTAVEEGELVKADTNKIYIALNRGTTATSGSGPAGTTNGQTDGDSQVTWDYYGPEAIIYDSTDMVSGGGDW